MPHAWTQPNKKCRILKVSDTQTYMVRHVGKREYRVFYNGHRTAYSGDSWEQAVAIVEHIVRSI